MKYSYAILVATVAALTAVVGMDIVDIVHKRNAEMWEFEINGQKFRTPDKQVVNMYLAQHKEVAALETKLNAATRQLADSTATFLRHVREMHLPPSSTDSLEWPEGWAKIELVCPTLRYTSKCRSVEYFHNNPSIDGKFHEVK